MTKEYARELVAARSQQCRTQTSKTAEAPRFSAQFALRVYRTTGMSITLSMNWKEGTAKHLSLLPTDMSTTLSMKHWIVPGSDPQTEAQKGRPPSPRTQHRRHPRLKHLPPKNPLLELLGAALQASNVDHSIAVYKWRPRGWVALPKEATPNVTHHRDLTRCPWLAPGFTHRVTI